MFGAAGAAVARSLSCVEYDVARHTVRAGRLDTALRLAALVLLWAAGLVVGFFALLSVGAKYSCSANAHGLACRPTGTALGVLVVLLVIAVVTAGTVLAPRGRRPGALAAVLVVSVVLLGGCYLAAHALLATA